MSYPHGADCRCAPLPADAGLLGYTVDCDHYQQLARALARMASKPAAVTLNVLTTDPAPANLVPLPSDPDPCDQSMTCRCGACVRERASRVRKGVRTAKQPWEPVRKAA